MSLQFGDHRLPQRFWAKVSPEPNSGCWLWLGSVAPGGYGQFWLNRQVRCNRLVMAVEHGDLRADQHVCHKCDNPNCCNPDHLWVGDASQNMTDAVAKGRFPLTRKRRLFCKRGHPRTSENLTGSVCKTCRREKWHERKLKETK